MAGYSGTSLPKKLGIKPNYRATFLDLPAEVKAELHDPSARVTSLKMAGLTSP